MVLALVCLHNPFLFHIPQDSIDTGLEFLAGRSSLTYRDIAPLIQAPLWSDQRAQWAVLRVANGRSEEEIRKMTARMVNPDEEDEDKQ